MLTVQQIFDLALKMGIKADPRGPKGIKEYLDRAKKEYDDLSPKEKKFFDKDRLENPYSDSRIHIDDKKTKVNRVLAGIDIDAGEVLLASQLGERKKEVDLIICHHPLGRSYANLHDTMDMLVDIYSDAGVPVHVAEKMMEARITEVGRGVHPINHYQIIDMASLLNINLINTHTFTDNLVREYLDNFIQKRKPKTIGDLVDVLLEIPEYEEAKKRGTGPKLFAGNPKHRLGKYIVDVTGGTSPASDMYKEISLYGISTIVGMHMKEDARKCGDDSHMNLLMCGHIASDSLGMNIFLDELEKKGIDIIVAGGLIRVSRVKNT